MTSAGDAGARWWSERSDPAGSGSAQAPVVLGPTDRAQPRAPQPLRSGGAGVGPHLAGWGVREGGAVVEPMGDVPRGTSEVADEARREALIQSIPSVDESTPLAAQLAADARLRIDLAGRRFPRPPRTRVLTIANQKGGVGKTSTAVNLAAALAQAGLNVLIIDNDPQGNASTALGVDHHSGTPSVYEVLIEDEDDGPRGPALAAHPPALGGPRNDRPVGRRDRAGVPGRPREPTPQRASRRTSTTDC